MPCPPAAWSARLASKRAWYSGVSGGCCAGPQALARIEDVGPALGHAHGVRIRASTPLAFQIGVFRFVERRRCDDGRQQRSRQYGYNERASLKHRRFLPGIDPTPSGSLPWPGSEHCNAAHRAFRHKIDLCAILQRSVSGVRALRGSRRNAYDIASAGPARHAACSARRSARRRRSWRIRAWRAGGTRMGQSMGIAERSAQPLSGGAVMTSIAAQAFDDAKYPDLPANGSRSGSASGPAGFRPDQALGPRPAGAVDARISEGAGGQHRRAGQRQPGQLAVRCLLPPARHAGDDDALSSDGNRGAAGDHLHPDRSHPPIPPPDLHRRARHGRRNSRRASAAIPSANGSIPTATASTTCSRSRPAS